MKKLIILLFAIPLIFNSCVSEIGPPGPPGAPGEDGLDGVNLLGQIFEVQVDFEANDNYSVIVGVPDEIEVFDSDVMLVYILTDVINDTDVWEPLPQTLFFDDEILLYGFNFTVGDVELFLDGTVSFSDLPQEFLNDVVFRVVVLPADAVQSIDVSTLSMTSIMASLNKQDIIKLN